MQELLFFNDSMKAYDIMSIDIEAAKENATVTEIGRRLILRNFVHNHS